MRCVTSMGLDHEMWLPVGHILKDAWKCGTVLAASVTVTKRGWFRRQYPVLRLHFEGADELDAFVLKAKTWSAFDFERSHSVIDVWPKG